MKKVATTKFVENSECRVTADSHELSSDFDAYRSEAQLLDEGHRVPSCSWGKWRKNTDFSTSNKESDANCPIHDERKIHELQDQAILSQQWPPRAFLVQAQRWEAG